jgi:predicted amidohydrolase
MKVAIAQISPHLGDMEKNLDIHVDLVERAQKNKVNLLVFPELSLTGFSND